MLEKGSQKILESCHRSLIAVIQELAKTWDIRVLYGQRGKKEQDEAFRTGRSQIPWPKSKHNKSPSEAVDIIFLPFKKDSWNDINKFCYMSGYAVGIAQQMGIKLRSGVDFNMNLVIGDSTIFDAPHLELVGDI